MAHTPGPWKATAPKKVGKHWRVGAVGKLGGKGAMGGVECLWNIAAIDNGAPGDTLDTEEANARLIAAAPELLAVCKVVADYDIPGRDAGPLMQQLLAAIAKATGESA